MFHFVSHRYYKFIRLFVIGMGASAILPWLILIGRSWADVPAVIPRYSGEAFRFVRLVNTPFLILFIAIWLLLLFFVFLFDWVNKWFNDDDEDQLIWRSVMVFLIVLILFPFNRMLLYPPAAAPMFTPARGILHTLFNFTEGARPESSLIFFYVVCWLFAIWVTSNALDYTLIGRLFQIGILSNLFSISWLVGFGGTNFFLFLPFIACSLTALALSQIDAKLAAGYHSQGARFSNSMWTQFNASIIGFVLICIFVANSLLPEQINSFLRLFTPIVNGIAFVLWGVLRFLGAIIKPIFIWVFTFIESLIGQFDPLEGIRADEGLTESDGLIEFPTFNELIVNPSFRYIFITILILLGLTVVLVVLNRTVLKQYRDGVEERSEEEVPEDFDPLGDGISRLRSWFNNLRGTRRKPLLAPERIEDMYANICRLADRRGFPRGISQSPDQYLDDLVNAFPGQADHLEQLTIGYMHSHYGEITLPSAEMQQLREAYVQFIASIEKDESESTVKNENIGLEKSDND